jgi:hypothetical protein
MTGKKKQKEIKTHISEAESLDSRREGLREA